MSGNSEFSEYIFGVYWAVSVVIVLFISQLCPDNWSQNISIFQTTHCIPPYARVNKVLWPVKLFSPTYNILRCCKWRFQAVKIVEEWRGWRRGAFIRINAAGFRASLFPRMDLIRDDCLPTKCLNLAFGGELDGSGAASVYIFFFDKSEVDIENGTSEARPARRPDNLIKGILSRGSPRRFQVDALLMKLVLLVLLHGSLVAPRVRFSTSDKGTSGCMRRGWGGGWGYETVDFRQKFWSFLFVLLLHNKLYLCGGATSSNIFMLLGHKCVSWVRGAKVSTTWRASMQQIYRLNHPPPHLMIC